MKGVLRVLRAFAALSALSGGVASAQPSSDTARAEELNREGKEKMRVLDLEAAADRFRQAIALEPDARYYFNLCFTLEKLDRFAEARAACEVTRKDATAADNLRDKAGKLVSRIDMRAKGSAGPATAPPTTLADGETVAQPGARPAPQPAPPPVAQPMPAATTMPGPVMVPPAPGPAASPTVTAPAPAPAADGAARPWSIGARAGISLATLDGGADDPDRRKGVAGGVVALLRVHPAVALQTEASYAQKGAEYSQGVTEVGLVSVEIHLDYLEVPVLLRLAAPGGGFRPYGLAGAGAGFLLDAKLTATIPGQPDQEGDTDTIKKTDFAGIVGGGLEIPAGSGAIGIEARYWFGMTDVEDSADATVKNRVLTIAGSYLF